MTNSLPQINQQRIINLEKAVDRITCNVEKLTNHYSRRLPPWGTWVITILAATIGVFAGIAF